MANYKSLSQFWLVARMGIIGRCAHFNVKLLHYSKIFRVLSPSTRACGLIRLKMVSSYTMYLSCSASKVPSVQSLADLDTASSRGITLLFLAPCCRANQSISPSEMSSEWISSSSLASCSKAADAERDTSSPDFFFQPNLQAPELEVIVRAGHSIWRRQDLK